MSKGNKEKVVTPPDERGSTGLLLSDDLIFTSRVLAEARALGLTVTPVRSVAALVDQAQRQSPHGILLDLAFPGLDLDRLLDELRAPGAPLPRLIAYGPHVEAAMLRAARAAGCDPVLPRSKFVEALPTELACWLA
jgi:CheY-like chemotaxis protein